MKELLVSYSYTGRNDKLASMIAENLDIKHIKINESKKRNAITFIKDLISKRVVKIDNDLDVINDYDKIIVVTPIWFGKISNPVINVLNKILETKKDFDIVTLRNGVGDDTPTIKNQITTLGLEQPTNFIDLHLNDFKKEEENISKLFLDENQYNILLEKILTVYKGD